MEPFAPRAIDRRAALGGLAAVALITVTAMKPFGTARATTPLGPTDHLLATIRERLDVAAGVAKAKWNSKGSIEDLEREKQLVDGVVRDAPDLGLDPVRAARFIHAQIDASKVIQAGLFAEWTRTGQAPFADAPDLKRDIRPVLDRLTPELLTRLGPAIAAMRDGAAVHLADVARADDPLYAAALAVAVAPLLEWARA